MQISLENPHRVWRDLDISPQDPAISLMAMMVIDGWSYLMSPVIRLFISFHWPVINGCWFPFKYEAGLVLYCLIHHPLISLTYQMGNECSACWPTSHAESLTCETKWSKNYLESHTWSFFKPTIDPSKPKSLKVPAIMPSKTQEIPFDAADQCTALIEVLASLCPHHWSGWARNRGWSLKPWVPFDVPRHWMWIRLDDVEESTMARGG